MSMQSTVRIVSVYGDIAWIWNSWFWNVAMAAGHTGLIDQHFLFDWFDNANDDWAVLNLAGHDFANEFMCDGFATLIENDRRRANDVWSMIDNQTCRRLANINFSRLMDKCFTGLFIDLSSPFHFARTIRVQVNGRFQSGTFHSWLFGECFGLL